MYSRVGKNFGKRLPLLTNAFSCLKMDLSMYTRLYNLSVQDFKRTKRMKSFFVLRSQHLTTDMEHKLIFKKITTLFFYEKWRETLTYHWENRSIANSTEHSSVKCKAYKENKKSAIQVQQRGRCNLIKLQTYTAIVTLQRGVRRLYAA